MRRPASLKARTNAEVFTIKMQDLQKVLKSHPGVIDIILRNAANFKDE